MIDFIQIAKEVDKVAEGIFLHYHIEKVEVKTLKTATRVKAVIVNDWNGSASTFTFEWSGLKLECKDVKNNDN